MIRRTLALLALVAAVAAVAWGVGLGPDAGPTEAAGSARLRLPAGTHFVPAAAAFWSRRRGLVVGYARDGSCLRRCRGAILRTGDGGRHWRLVRLTRFPALSASAAAGRYAWVSTQACAPAPRIGTCRGRALLRSGDGGRTWQAVAHGRGTDATFAGRNRGWADGPGQTIRATDDGGRTWHQVASPCDRAAAQTPLWRATARVGWVVCTHQPGAGTRATRVFRTGDAGAHWRRTAGVLPGDGDPTAIAVGPDGRGFVTMARAGLYRTGDGGRHWRRLPVSRPRRAGAGSGVALSAQLVSRRAGFLLRVDKPHVVLARTDDGGRHWRRVARWPWR